MTRSAVPRETPRPDARTEDDIALQVAARLPAVAEGSMGLAQAFGYDDAALKEAADVGQVLQRQGKHENARRVFAGLVALDPSVPMFHAGLADALAGLGLHDEAKATWDACVTAAAAVPGAPDLLGAALVARAGFRFDHGDVDGAREDAARALALPDDALAPNEKAACARIAGAERSTR